jgi:hypothetical protein
MLVFLDAGSGWSWSEVEVREDEANTLFNRPSNSGYW